MICYIFIILCPPPFRFLFFDQLVKSLPKSDYLSIRGHLGKLFGPALVNDQLLSAVGNEQLTDLNAAASLATAAGEQGQLTDMTVTVALTTATSDVQPMADVTATAILTAAPADDNRQLSVSSHQQQLAELQAGHEVTAGQEMVNMSSDDQQQKLTVDKQRQLIDDQPAPGLASIGQLTAVSASDEQLIQAGDDSLGHLTVQPIDDSYDIATSAVGGVDPVKDDVGIREAAAVRAVPAGGAKFQCNECDFRSAGQELI